MSDVKILGLYADRDQAVEETAKIAQQFGGTTCIYMKLVRLGDFSDMGYITIRGGTSPVVMIDGMPAWMFGKVRCRKGERLDKIKSRFRRYIESRLCRYIGKGDYGWLLA